VVWKAEGLGEGYSSYSIASGRLFTQGQRGDAQFLYGLDANTGKKIWETAAGGSFRERRGHGPRGTPTVDGDTVYAVSADGTVLSLEAATGKKNWEFNMLRKFGGQQIHWGISESPLVDGDRLYVQPGGPKAAVVALEKKTGKPIWNAGEGEAGYSSAIIFDFGGQRHLVSFNSERAIGYNAANGWVMWQYDKVANRTANIATPIFHDGHVFLSSDYGTGCALLKLEAKGDRVTATEVYFSSEMKNHYCTSVLAGKHLYGFSSSILTCLDFYTGAAAWRDRSVGKGQIALVGDLLILQGENGEVALAEANPSAYKELSRFTFGRGEYPLWAQPVVANGRLYLRDQDKLACLQVAKT
jgi:outer membrane protein assembly factor BamB